MRKLIATLCTAAALLAPATAAVATESGPIVSFRDECPPGYGGRIVYVGDRGLVWLCYPLP